MLRQDDFLKSKLVETAWRAGLEYGGYLPACMIASVLMNRVKKGWGKVLDVIETIPKFAATDTPSEFANKNPQVWEPSFVKLLHEIDGIYEGVQDYSKGALYWGDTRFMDSEFFQNKILGNPDHPRVVEQNSLCFFK